MEGNLKGKEGNTTESQKLKNKRKKEKKRKEKESVSPCWLLVVL